MTSRRRGKWTTEWTRRSVAAAILIATGAPREADAQIRATHPRIFLTNTSVSAMQLRWAAKSDSELNEVVGFATRSLSNPTGVDTQLRGDYPDTVALPTALAAVITGESRFVNASLSHLDVLLGIAAPTGGDTAWRNRLLSMAVIYDWLHTQLGTTRATSTRNAIVAHMNENHGFVAAPDFVSGHSRWGNATSLAGCIALDGEDSRVAAECTAVVDNWQQGYVPTLDHVGAGGGHHMGWMYGSAYSSVEPMLMWWSATGELWNPEFLRDSAYFSLYAVDEAFNVPASGDAFGVYFTSSLRSQVAMSAAFGGNAYAEHLAQRLPPAWGPHAVIRSIVKNNLPPKAPDDLPLSRHFSGSGFVVARNTWSGVPAVVTFKSSPFYSYNHHHRDENAVALSYKGALLSDGGFYDGYGSTHHQNFYTRSIAHNTLLVDLPGETFRGWANDGGQRIPASWAAEPKTVADLTGPAKLDGIERHATREGVTWARGNASKAYATTKVSAFLRDVLFVPTPDDHALPVMLVVDHVALPVEREARIAWQLPLAPTVNGTTSAQVASTGGGHARMHFLAPTQRALRSFSGVERYAVDGVNYPPTTESTGTPPYWGRLEVAAPAAFATTFSTAVVVSDAPLDTDTAPRVTRVSGSSWEGAEIGTTLVLVATGTLNQLPIARTRSSLSRIYVAGLAPNQALAVDFSGTLVTFTADNDGLIAGPVSGGQVASVPEAAPGPIAPGAVAPVQVTDSAPAEPADNANSNKGCGCSATHKGADSVSLVMGLAAVAAMRRRSKRA